MDSLCGNASLGLAFPQERVDEMSKFFPQFTSKQAHWSNTGAGNLASPHLCLGVYLIFVLLWDNVGDLLRNDFTGFIIWMSLMVIVAVTAVGTLVIYFVAQANVRGSERNARHSYLLAIAYLCFSIGVVGISWTYLIGFAMASLLYLAEALALLVFARRTYMELRAAGEWASMR